jgi:hypothetical protein
MVYRHRKSQVSISSFVQNEEEFVIQKGQKVHQDELVLMHRKKLKYPQDDTEFYSNIWSAQPSKYSRKKIDIIQVAYAVSRRIDYKEEYPFVNQIKNIWDSSLDLVLEDSDDEDDRIFIPPRDSDIVSNDEVDEQVQIDDDVIQATNRIEPEPEQAIFEYESLQQHRMHTLEDSGKEAANNKKNRRHGGLLGFFQKLLSSY